MKMLLASSLLIAFALASGCSKSQSTAAGNDSAEQSQDSLIAGVDKHGDEIMASSTKTEARQWMKQPKHVFFKADPKEVAQFVEDFYQAGAVQVFIADIEEENDNQYGESLLVVLPKDANARAKLFEVEARADTAFQDDPVTDKGQKYLYNGLD
jgi:hypothetical protein